jgi:HSP20 family protein
MMKLARWEPFGGFDESFDRLLPGLLGRWPRMALDQSAIKYQWKPSADISETEQEYLIRAELPAVKKEDVKVTFEGGVLSIQGERRQQTEEKSEKVHRTETFHGTFARSFALPDNISADAIKCESKDGILTVHVPKLPAKQTPQAKQIRVE